MLLLTITTTLLLLAAAIWAYARAYPRRSINPADYPWLERAATETPEQMAASLLGRMSLSEKLDQLSGDGGDLVLLRLGVNVLGYKQFPNMYAGYNARLRIPPLSFTDGPRGIVVGQATGFPVAMARGATWDVELERRVADALGREARAVGANYFGGICVNLLRHPGWGRAQETWGEDPFHVGEMAAACVEGVQQHNVMACVKHFAVNNIENSRFYVDVQIDPRSLHEVYLPHFRRCVEAGAASLMSAYNRINGDFCAHQPWLLEDILRGQWGFTGFVTSDWVWGIHDGVKGIAAGMDVEMPRANAYRPARLKRALARGQISEVRIDTMVQRILATRLRFASRPDPESYDRKQLACDAHVQLAQEVAEKSMVLLQNREQCLPFNGIQRLAVIGELAAQPNTGDNGSSRTSPPSVVTVLEGLQQWLGKDRVVYHDGCDPVAAAALAADCDAALVVAGCWPEDEGENLVSNHKPGGKPGKHRGGDREDLSLAPAQVAMIRAVGAAQARTAATLIGGSAMYTDGWRDSVGAIVMAWYPGMHGGPALAKLLSGALDFSGRLPLAWPAADNRLPAFDSHAARVDYDYYHGYTWLDHSQQRPAYAMGFGLSYAPPCDYSDLQVSQRDEAVIVRVTLRNAADRVRREVAQCYVGMPAELAVRHRKNLKAFAVVELGPGESRELVLTIPLQRLRRYCPQTENWVLDEGDYRLWVGPSSDESQCLQALVKVGSITPDT